MNAVLSVGIPAWRQYKGSKCNILLQRSRSGRIIAPPLEYWRGQRMMVTHDDSIAIVKCHLEETSIQLVGENTVSMVNRELLLLLLCMTMFMLSVYRKRHLCQGNH